MLQLKVPPLGESIVEATISRWLKKEGESVAAGETVVELDTDKITVEVAAMRAGVLTKRAKNEGDVVKVDEVLGEIDETAAAAAAEAPAPVAAGQTSNEGAIARPAESAPAAAAEPARPAAEPARPAAEPASGAAGGGDQRASPAAKRAADERGVDLGAVQGTGRGGVVSKPDVIEQAAREQTPSVAAPAAAPAPPAPAQPPAQAPAQPPAQAPAQAPAVRAPASDGQREKREKMSVRRKRIAERLLESQQSTAHLTTFNEIDMTAVLAVRERLKERIEKQHGVKLTFMPFFVKAACVALKEFPVINAQVDGDSIVYRSYVHMGIAVASDDGLVVPNIRDADSKGMLQISRDIVDVAKRARDRKLTMDDLTGGTFTITNGGVFGSLVSTPIINFPQVGILGLHKIQERPVVIDGRIEIRPMMYVALSYDHRIVDGQQSVLFLVRLKELMEDPAAMLVSD